MKYRMLSFLLILSLLFLPESALAVGDEAAAAADQLYSLGLLQGTGTNDDGTPIYALDQQPTRAEALVMLLRLLGVEEDAQKGTWDTPFTDVPEDSWAASYIGYAYENGITTGVAADQFGLSEENVVTAAQYITFLLRALGYDDGAGDFTLETAVTFAASIGLDMEPDWVDDNFNRGDVACLSCAALSLSLKNSDQTLSDALGLVVYGEYTTPATTATSVDAEQLTAYTAEDIEAQCAAAVFQITVYDEAGKAVATGSGFFIDESGTAVTCYHVIYATASATVTLSCYDGNTYPVSDVLYCDADEDIAILRVSDVSTTGASITSFPALTISSRDLEAGDTVYAIGHPNGKALTVSAGSYLETTVEDYHSYYSSDAVIYPGNSGGALVDQYGQVVGITAAIMTEHTSISLSTPISVVTAHNWSSSGTAYSASSTVRTDQYVLTASDYSITVSNGSYETVTIADVFTTGALYTCESSDERIAVCGWSGTVLDPANMTLKIYGYRAGTAEVTVSLLDSSNCVLSTVTIHVTVER